MSTAMGVEVAARLLDHIGLSMLVGRVGRIELICDLDRPAMLVIKMPLDSDTAGRMVADLPVEGLRVRLQDNRPKPE